MAFFSMSRDRGAGVDHEILVAIGIGTETRNPVPELPRCFTDSLAPLRLTLAESRSLASALISRAGILRCFRIVDPL